MMRLFRAALASALLLLSPRLSSAITVVSRLDLKPVPAKVGRLFPEGPETVRIVVKDERPASPFLVTGGGEADFFGRRVIQGFYTDDPGTVASLFEAGARDALEILGMKPGDGVVLEISIKEFRVEMANPSFGLPNVIAYGRVQAAVKSGDGGEPASRDFKIAHYETSQRPFEALYERAAWEVTARSLLARFPKKAEPEAIRRVLSSLDTNKDDRQREYAVFWLGLAGQDNPAVTQKLFALFHREKDQSVSQQAAVSLAMLGVPEARSEFEAVLSGSKKLSEWDPKGDAENAWHLLHGLALLGATDLGPKVPATKRLHEKLTDLVRFHEKGEIPKTSQQDLNELTAKLEKKRKG
jgi:hypothetical protein